LPGVAHALNVEENPCLGRKQSSLWVCNVLSWMLQGRTSCWENLLPSATGAIALPVMKSCSTEHHRYLLLCAQSICMQRVPRTLVVGASVTCKASTPRFLSGVACQVASCTVYLKAWFQCNFKHLHACLSWCPCTWSIGTHVASFLWLQCRGALLWGKFKNENGCEKRFVQKVKSTYKKRVKLHTRADF